jgi:hypothetical protein
MPLYISKDGNTIYVDQSPLIDLRLDIESLTSTVKQVTCATSRLCMVSLRLLLYATIR